MVKEGADYSINITGENVSEYPGRDEVPRHAGAREERR